MSTPQAQKAADAVFRHTHPPIRFTENPSYCEETIARCAEMIDAEMPSWKPMESAPKDGTPFIWMGYVTVLTTPPTFDPYCDVIRRFWLGDARGVPRVGEGFWMGKYGSRGDMHLQRGWWMPLPSPEDA